MGKLTCTKPQQSQTKCEECAYLLGCTVCHKNLSPDSKVHGANMGPIWGRQDPGGPHVVPMNFAIWVNISLKML